MTFFIGIRFAVQIYVATFNLWLSLLLFHGDSAYLPATLEVGFFHVFDMANLTVQPDAFEKVAFGDIAYTHVLRDHPAVLYQEIFFALEDVAQFVTAQC